MFSWILNTIGYNEDNFKEVEEENNLKLDNFIKKRAVRIIEKNYLCYKKNLELRKIRAERRKLYRILNRTNPNLLAHLKSKNKYENSSKSLKGIKY